MKWCCNSNVVYMNELVSIKQILLLKWPNQWPKSDSKKKKKNFPLPMPILETSRIQLRSGPWDWGGNVCNSVLTNWNRSIGHSQLTQLRSHELSFLSSHRKVQAGWIHQSIFILMTTMLFLRCPNWMSYRIGPCFHPFHLLCWPSCRSRGRDPELFRLHWWIFDK